MNTPVLGALDVWHAALLMCAGALIAGFLVGNLLHRPKYPKIDAAEWKAAEMRLPLRPERFIAGVSAVIKGINRWQKSRDRYHSAMDFDVEFFVVLSRFEEIEARGAAISMALSEEELNGLMERSRIWWMGYRVALGNESGVPDRIDQATETVKKCIDRELGRIVELYGSLPDTELGAMWNSVRADPFRE